MDEILSIPNVTLLHVDAREEFPVHDIITVNANSF
jgi:hypothetical protein